MTCRFNRLTPGIALGILLTTGWFCAAETIIWDHAALLRARERLNRNDDESRKLRAELVTVARESLRQQPGSVLDKELTAGSGDKHDFLSWAIYWWPDPEKPDGRPYIYRDGRINPEGGRGKTDTAAAARMLRHTPILALAYFYTGERRYAEHAAHFLRKWFVSPETRMNPHFNYGEVRPGHDGDRGGYTGLIILALRMHLVLDSLALIRDSGCWSETDETAFRKWLTDYLDWLHTSPLAQKAARNRNNLATYFAGHLAMIQLYLGRKDAARKVVTDFFHRSFAQQFGVGGKPTHELVRTLSFTYAVSNAKGWLNLATIGEKTGFDAWQYRTADGLRFRDVAAYFTPYAAEGTVWPHRQLKKPDRRVLWDIMVRAARHDPDPAFRTALRQLRDAPGIAMEQWYFPYEEPQEQSRQAPAPRAGEDGVPAAAPEGLTSP